MAGRHWRSLTGSALSADALADACNHTVDEAVAKARIAAARVTQAARVDNDVDLEAHIRVVHGRETLADTADGGFGAACARFEAWVDVNVTA